MLKTAPYRYALSTTTLHKTRHLAMQSVQRFVFLCFALIPPACSKPSSGTEKTDRDESSLEQGAHENLENLPEACTDFLRQQHDQIKDRSDLNPRRREELQEALKAKRFALKRIKSSPGSKAALNQLCSQLKTQASSS